MRNIVVRLLVVLLSITMVSFALADNHSNDNVTSLSDSKDGGEERYSIELRAKDIQDNTFYVPVEYYNALVKKTRLKATLNIPLRLNVSSSRKRRLLMMYTNAGDAPEPYGLALDKVAYFKIGNYKATNDKAAFTDYNGSRDDIFRSVLDAKDHAVDFELPVDHRHFHQGYLRVSIGATNGDHLTEICEVVNANCLTSALIRIQPRKVDYSVETDDVSDIASNKPRSRLDVIETTIPLNVVSSGKIIGKVAAFGENEYTLSYSRQSGSASSGSYSSNVSLNPQYLYMSNDSYDANDVVNWSNSIYRPDLLTGKSTCLLSIRSDIALGYDKVILNGEEIGYTPQRIEVQPGSRHEIEIIVAKENNKAEVGSKKTASAVCRGDSTTVRLVWGE